MLNTVLQYWCLSLCYRIDTSHSVGILILITLLQYWYWSLGYSIDTYHFSSIDTYHSVAVLILIILLLYWYLSVCYSIDTYQSVTVLILITLLQYGIDTYHCVTVLILITLLKHWCLANLYYWCFYQLSKTFMSKFCVTDFNSTMLTCICILSLVKCNAVSCLKYQLRLIANTLLCMRIYTYLHRVPMNTSCFPLWYTLGVRLEVTTMLTSSKGHQHGWNY